MSNQGMPLSTIVKASFSVVSEVSQQQQNPNMILYLTTQQPISAVGILPFKTYYNATDVGKDYGTSLTVSTTGGNEKPSVYAYAQQIFSQQPYNILSGKGSLTIAPYLPTATDASPARFKTASIVANITNFASITNGAISFNIDGVVLPLTGLNFKGVQTVEDIASILQSAITKSYALVGADATGNAILTASQSVGALVSSISMAQLTPLPSGATDLSGANYFNVSTATTTSALDSTGETPDEAIIRIKADPSVPLFFSVLTDKILDNQEAKGIASFTQSNSSNQDSNPFLFTYGFSSLNATELNLASDSQIASEIKTLGYSMFHMTFNANSSSVIAGTDSLLLNPFALAFAEISMCSSVNFTLPAPSIGTSSVVANASNSAFPSNRTNCIGVLSDVVSQAQKDAIQNAGMDAYYQIGGLASIFASSENGGWFNTKYFTLYLQLQAQVYFAQIIRGNGIVPTNNQGISLLINAGITLMQNAFTSGMITTDNDWSGNLPTGLPQELAVQFYNGIRTKGYYIYNPGINSVSSEQKAQGVAPTTYIYGKLSGVYQVVEIQGVVQQS